ncbi:hypothetical protein ACFWIK_08955 [Streptomyces anthocyanicus]|uniref:hypothetical protein n=1 Tax=Streptomyces anthocyanicus TaxID=68174 RepID=UPI00365EF363
MPNPLPSACALFSCWGRTPRQFFVSRVIRLYPACWFAVLFTTAALIAVPGVWERLRPREVLLDLTMLPSGSGVPDVDGVYWTLWSELRFHLLLPVVVAMGLTYRRVVVLCRVWGAVAMPAPVARLPLLELAANPDGAWYSIAGLALHLMHRFGQDLLLRGILAMAWLMGQLEPGNRIEDVERVRAGRCSTRRDRGSAPMTRTSTTSRSENFAVRVLATPSPGGTEGAGEALGCIRVGEFEERFPMSVSYWNVARYEMSWRRCLELLVEGGPDTTSCLVTSITDPANSNFVFCWPLYRSGSIVHVQNSIMFLDELEEEFAPDEPWRFVEPRSTVDEDGQEISEWRTTVQDVERFLQTEAR